MTMTEKVTEMRLKVDLQCPCCHKKVKKILCKFPQIRDQVYDEKNNMAKIIVVCCSPEKIRDKLCCKAKKVIKSIEIVEPPPSPKNKGKPAPVPAPADAPPEPVPVPVPDYPIRVCCPQCYQGHPGGPCYQGYGRPVPPPPCYDGYGYPYYSYNRGCYVSRCGQYFGDENPYVSRCDQYFGDENPSACSLT